MNGGSSPDQRERGRSPAAALIGTGLMIVGLSLLFARGLYTVGLGFMGVGLVWQALSPNTKIRMSPPVKTCLWGLAGVLGLGLWPNLAHYPLTALPLLQAMLIVLALNQPLEVPGISERTGVRGSRAALALFALFLSYHLLGDALYRGNPSRGYPGFFKNIHFLGEYAVLTVPLFTLEAVRRRGVLRIGWLVLVCVDLGLLLGSKSRPGFLALVASILVLVPWLNARQRSRLLLSAGAVLGGFYALDLLGFASRINEFMVHIREDERAEIWAGTLSLMQSAPPYQWLLGHGFGQFFQDYHQLSLIRQTKTWIAPHNFILDVLYSHGLLGLLLVTSGFLMIGYQLIHQIRETREPSWREEGLVLLSQMTALLVHAFFTVPFFSRDFLLPFSLLLGWLLRRAQPPPRCS